MQGGVKQVGINVVWQLKTFDVGARRRRAPTAAGDNFIVVGQPAAVILHTNTWRGNSPLDHMLGMHSELRLGRHADCIDLR